MKLKRILSIDGGGIRGIIPGQIILEIEKEFNIIVSDYFDLVAGTSTGGILTCAYLCPSDTDPNKPKFTAQEVVNMYLNRGGDIFDIPTFHKIRTLGGLLDEKYPEDGLEEVLQDYLGNVWLKDLLKPCIVTSYDIQCRKGHFFGQHKAKNDPNFNFRVKDVARATSAAPTYFECAEVFSESKPDKRYALIDGGVFVNNPSLVAYTEGRGIFNKEDGSSATAVDMKVLSIGTGYSYKKYHYSKAKNYGKAEWIQPIIDIMMSGSADVAAYQIDKIYQTTPKPLQYLRIDGDLKNTNIDPEMDCATPENIQKLKEFGSQLFEDKYNEIEAWLEL